MIIVTQCNNESSPIEMREFMTQYESNMKQWCRKLWQGIKNIWRYYRGWKWGVFLTLLISLVGSTYMLVIAKTTDVSNLQEAIKSQTTVFDQYDNEVGSLSSQKGTYIPIEQISDTMLQTVVATEDKRFFEHNGFDAKGIGRAAFRLLINRNTSGGGGSTITQQLVKNAFLNADQTFQRKIKELFLAIEVEKQFEKSQILEMYLNYSYFGSGVWGVEDASMKYFGHSAVSLSWLESAVLTGILKGPSIYNPIDDYDAAIKRRNVVLDILAQEQIVDLGTIDEIKTYDIALYDAYSKTQNYTYPAYFDAVINEALSRTDISESELLSKGYKIFTHLNTTYQDVLNNSYYYSGIFPENDGTSPLIQSASAVVNPKTGGVMALFGGRGETVYRGFNRATSMARAPGSTIKPLAVYTSALENGYNMHSIVPDIVQSYGGEHYTPQNHDKTTVPEGELPLYLALAQSKNTTAVYLMDKLGISKSVSKLEQFGISVSKKDQNLSLALGGITKGVSPLQLANAYSAFANEGIRHESYLIRKIEDATGKVVYTNDAPSKYKVMTSTVAKDMTSMMLDVYGGYGTGYGATPDYAMIAGKTGTTEISEENSLTRDRWMVGFTPDFVIASWIGFDEVSDSADLDAMMPNGMSQLFRNQTTGLFEVSPQNSFGLTFASQMTAHTNKHTIFDLSANTGVSEESINQVVSQVQENVSGFVDQAKQWASDTIAPTMNQIVDSVTNVSGDVIHQAQEWLNSVFSRNAQTIE